MLYTGAVLVKRDDVAGGPVRPDLPQRRAAGPPLITAARQDSFDRPDSPLFHETLPLPAESAIRRHRQRSRGRRVSTASSSESEGAGDEVQKTGAQRWRRHRRHHQRCRRAASAGARTRRGRPASQMRFVVTLGRG